VTASALPERYLFATDADAAAGTATSRNRLGAIQSFASCFCGTGPWSDTARPTSRPSRRRAGTHDAQRSESAGVTLAMIQPGLFGSGGETASQPPPRRRGRGAVTVQRHVVTLAAPNPAGRRTVTFEYRPLLTWTEQRLAAVRELLVLYFGCIGGFWRAGNATVGAWHDALVNGTFTADELRWGIEVKAASLIGSSPEDTRDRRRYAAHPRRFIATGAAGYWLSQSAEYHARQQAQRAAEGQRLRLLLAEVRRARRSGPEGLLAGGAGASAPAAAERAAEVRRTAFWMDLRPVQRVVALAAVRPMYTARCEQWGENPDDPKLTPVLLGMATEWAGRKWPPAAASTSDLFGFEPNTSRL